MRPRIRSVKPDIFHDEQLWKLGEETNMPVLQGFEGLWCYADREGRFEWRPMALKSLILPYWRGDFEALLDALAGAGMVVRYVVGDRVYGWLRNFTKHQRINAREPESTIPAPPEIVPHVHDIAPHVHDIAPHVQCEGPHVGIGNGMGVGMGMGESTSSPPPAAVDPPTARPTELAAVRELAATSPPAAAARVTELAAVREVVATSPPAAAPTARVNELAAVREVFATWQRVHGHLNAVLDARRTARIRNALKHHTTRELQQAIRGALKDDWLMMRDPKSPRKYDGLETILRDSAQIERLIDLETGKVQPIRRATSGSLQPDAGRTGAEHFRGIRV